MPGTPGYSGQADFASRGFRGAAAGVPENTAEDRTGLPDRSHHRVIAARRWDFLLQTGCLADCGYHPARHPAAVLAPVPVLVPVAVLGPVPAPVPAAVLAPVLAAALAPVLVALPAAVLAAVCPAAF